MVPRSAIICLYGLFWLPISQGLVATTKAKFSGEDCVDVKGTYDLTNADGERGDTIRVSQAGCRAISVPEIGNERSWFPTSAVTHWEISGNVFHVTVNESTDVLRLERDESSRIHLADGSVKENGDLQFGFEIIGVKRASPRHGLEACEQIAGYYDFTINAQTNGLFGVGAFGGPLYESEPVYDFGAFGVFQNEDGCTFTVNNAEGFLETWAVSGNSIKVADAKEVNGVVKANGDIIANSTHVVEQTVVEKTVERTPNATREKTVVEKTVVEKTVVKKWWVKMLEKVAEKAVSELHLQRPFFLEGVSRPPPPSPP